MKVAEHFLRGCLSIFHNLSALALPSAFVFDVQVQDSIKKITNNELKHCQEAHLWTMNNDCMQLLLITIAKQVSENQPDTSNICPSTFTTGVAESTVITKSSVDTLMPSCVCISDISINGNRNRNGNGNDFFTAMESKNGNELEMELE